MKDILFRAKRKDNNEWIYGYLIKGEDYLTNEPITAIVEENATFFPRNEIAGYELVIPETVGQFTGKYDKSGLKIFEGDILLTKIDYGPAGMKDAAVTVDFCVDNGYEWQYLDMSIAKVIDNIHDNPNWNAINTKTTDDILRARKGLE